MVSGICLAGGGPTGRRSSPNGWGAASLAVKPRLLNAAQWRLVIEQRRDLDDECAGSRCRRQSRGADFGTIPARMIEGKHAFPAARRPYPQEIDRARALPLTLSRVFNDLESRPCRCSIGPGTGADHSRANSAASLGVSVRVRK